MKRAQGAMLLSEMGIQASGIGAGPSGNSNFAAEGESMALKRGFLAVCKRRRGMEAESMAAQTKRRQSEKIRPEGEDASSSGLLLAPSTPSRKLHRQAREADLDAPQDFVNLLPEAVALKIFSKVPPRDLASKCSLICKSWARLAGAEGLWKDFCTPSGLTECDTAKVLGGWRGLFAAAFATNLVQSSHFERYQENESVFDQDDEPSAFQARAKVLVERLVDTDTVEMEYRCRSHWTDDVEGLEHLRSRVNSAFRTRITAQSLAQQADSRVASQSYSSLLGATGPLPEAQPMACREDTGNDAAYGADPAPASSQAAMQTSCGQGGACQEQSASAGGVNDRDAAAEAALGAGTTTGGVAGAGGGAATATASAGVGAEAGTLPLTLLHDHLSTRPEAGVEAIRTAPTSWGRLQQSISLAAFPHRFLDTCPPIRISAWCTHNVEGAPEVASRFRLQLVLCSQDGIPLHHWDSGDMDWSNSGWRCFTAVVLGYPQGVRSIIVKVAGKGVDYTKVQAKFSPAV